MKEEKRFSADIVISAITGIMICGDFSDIVSFFEEITGENMTPYSAAMIYERDKDNLQKQYSDLINIPEMEIVNRLGLIQDRELRGLVAETVGELVGLKYSLVTPVSLGS